MGTNILPLVDTPEKLKKLSVSDLPALATEIRSRIVSVVSKNGGHLASSLGAVDLAISLHYVFSSPEDVILWDVGHQAYAHKLLTNRWESFDTLRQWGGVAGFLRRGESEHDIATSGHSSGSISTGLGISVAKRLSQKTGKTVVVIGDGAMTGGVAFEGLNHAGDIHKNLIIVLNDNEMSISPNVGALASILSRTFSQKKMQGFKKDVGDFLKSVPGIGKNLYNFAKRSEESIKSLISPGTLFEALGYEYFGPIDGHNILQLITMLDNIKEAEEPILLHVVTQKGKGYAPAEENPVFFHGIGKFDPKTGIIDSPSPISNAPTYTDVFGQALVDLAQKDPQIVAITAAMPEGTGLTQFARIFPTRFFDVGIAEQHAVAFAAGIATQGFKPVVAIYSTFLQRAFDQIIHDVCIDKLPIVFAVDRAGIVGEDGVTHQGTFDISYLRMIPNMTIMMPKDENELRQMLVTAFSIQSPVAIRYPRGKSVGVSITEKMIPLPFGKCEIVQEGQDVLILAAGLCVSTSLEAATLLEKEKITATIINARFIKPLDTDEIVRWCKMIPRVITVEENVLAGGFGSSITELLADHGIHNVKIRRLGISDMFIEHGSQEILRQKHHLTAEAICQAVKEVLMP